MCGLSEWKESISPFIGLVWLRWGPLLGNRDLEALKRNVGVSALDVLLYHGAPADTGCSLIARESIASF
jgi:hypothetical protein